MEGNYGRAGLGTVRNGSAKTGNVSRGMVRFGTDWLGMVWYGGLRLGVARSCPVWMEKCGSVWLDSHRFGLLVFGAVGFGWRNWAGSG